MAIVVRNRRFINGTRNMNRLSEKYGRLKGEYNFYKELAGSYLSRFGDGIDTIAFSILIYHITGSTMLMATLFAVNGLPNLFFSIISGVVSTHKDEKKIMAFCDLGRGLCVTVIAVLYLTDAVRIWHLYVITFLNSSFESFRAPASAVILPKILREEIREEGLALETGCTKWMEVFGLAIASTIIGWGGLGMALMIDAITFILCAFLVMSIKTERKPYSALDLAGSVRDIQEGFQYVKLHREVLNICIFTSIVNIAFIPVNVYQVPYVEDILLGNDNMLSVMGVSSALAIGAGAFCMPKWKEVLGGRNSFLGGGMLIGAAYLVLIGIRSMNIYWKYAGLVLGMALLGLGTAAATFIIQVRFFREVEEEYLARVSAISSMFALCVTPVFSSISGVLLEFISLPMLFAASGIFVVFVFLVNYLKEKP